MIRLSLKGNIIIKNVIFVLDLSVVFITGGAQNCVVPMKMRKSLDFSPVGRFHFFCGIMGISLLFSFLISRDCEISTEF